MSKRFIFTVLIVVAVLGLAAMIYVLAFGASGSSQASQLDANLHKWQAQNVSHYRMQVNIGCFCAFRDRMPVTVEVQDGRVVEMLDNQGHPLVEDDPLRANMPEPLFTIEGLFGYTRDALQRADEVKVEYDPVLGFPSTLNVDFIKLAIDDEMSVLISGLEVLPAG